MKKAIFIVVLIFSLFTTTEFAYAYFDEDSRVMLNDESPLYKLKGTMSSNDKTLIPREALLGENDTYEVEYFFVVYVEKGLDLTSEISDIYFVDGEVDNIDLTEILDFEIRHDVINEVEIEEGIFTENTVADEVQIIITVSFQDGITYEEYQEMMGQQIEYLYTLSIAKYK